MERTQVLNRRLEELKSQAAQNEPEIGVILEELRTSPITLAILQHTKIGLTVNNVRRCPGVSAATNQRALRLIAEWKQLAGKAMAAAAAATTAASAPAAATAATPPNAPKPSTAGGSVAAAADTSAKRKLDADREDDAKKAKPTPNGAAASSSAAAPAAASPARAAAAPSPSPPSPTPPVPQLYNPNLFAYRAPGPVARQTPANTVIDYTSRKRTMESSVDSFLMPVTPTSSAPVNLCTLEQMCCDHIAAHLDKFAFLDAIPVPAMLKALSKASAEQLTKFEKANPRLLGETESLWRVLYKRTYPTLRDVDITSSTWKQSFLDAARSKQDKIQAMSLKLRAMQQSQAQEKQAGGIKSMNMQSAVRIENKSKAQPARTGAYPQPPNRYAKLKQDAKAVSNIKYAWNDRR